MTTVLIVTLCIYALITPLLLLKAFKIGLRYGKSPEKEAEKPFFNVPKKEKPAKLTKEQQEEIDYFVNIMNYDGTNKGQKQIGE